MLEALRKSFELAYKRLPPAEKRRQTLEKKRREEKKRLQALLSSVRPFERFLVELAVKKWVGQEYSVCGKSVKAISQVTGLSPYKISRLIRELGLRQARPDASCNHDLSLIREWATKYPKWGTSLAELDLDRLLREHFPHQWRYVGDWRLAIDGKCPDFVHANRKLIIELFGEWHHLQLKQHHRPELTKERAEKERIAHFAAYGYRTLVIWSKELRDVEAVIGKVRKFVREADVTRPAD